MHTHLLGGLRVGQLPPEGFDLAILLLCLHYHVIQLSVLGIKITIRMDGTDRFFPRAAIILYLHQVDSSNVTNLAIWCVYTNGSLPVPLLTSPLGLLLLLSPRAPNASAHSWSPLSYHIYMFAMFKQHDFSGRRTTGILSCMLT